MKRLILASIASLCLSFFAASAFAAAPSCADQAASKKLAGAALTSFMKKCQKDATASCEATAKDKKLAGAAKVSFVKKCVKDTAGK